MFDAGQLHHQLDVGRRSLEPLLQPAACAIDVTDAEQQSDQSQPQTGVVGIDDEALGEDLEQGVAVVAGLGEPLPQLDHRCGPGLGLLEGREHLPGEVRPTGIQGAVGGGEADRFAGRMALGERDHLGQQDDAPELRVDIQTDRQRRRFATHGLEDVRRLVVETPFGVPTCELESRPAEIGLDLDGVAQELVDRRLFGRQHPLEDPRFAGGLGPGGPTDRPRLTGAHRLRPPHDEISGQRHRRFVTTRLDRPSDLVLEVPHLGRLPLRLGGSLRRRRALPDTLEGAAVGCGQTRPEPPVVGLAGDRCDDGVGSPTQPRAGGDLVLRPLEGAGRGQDLTIVDPDPCGLGGADPDGDGLFPVGGDRGREKDELPLRRPGQAGQPDPSQRVGALGGSPTSVGRQLGEVVEVGELADAHGIGDPPPGKTAHAAEELARRSRSARFGGEPRPHGSEFVGHQRVDPGQGAESVEGSVHDRVIRGGVAPVEGKDEVVEVLGLEPARRGAVDVVEDSVLDLAGTCERTREDDQKHEEQAARRGHGCAGGRIGDPASVVHAAHRDSIAEPPRSGTANRDGNQRLT